METLVSPRMLLCSLKRLCLASLALAFLTVRDVRVKGSRVSPGCRLVSRAKIKCTLGHVPAFIFDRFFSVRLSRYFQEFGKRHPQALIHSERCIIFEKKKIQNFDYPVQQSLKITNTLALFSLLYVHPRPALAPCGLGVCGKSVKSRTCTVSSHVTLARESCWTHSARVYSRHKTSNLLGPHVEKWPLTINRNCLSFKGVDSQQMNAKQSECLTYPMCKETICDAPQRCSKRHNRVTFFWLVENYIHFLYSEVMTGSEIGKFEEDEKCWIWKCNRYVTHLTPIYYTSITNPWFIWDPYVTMFGPHITSMNHL